MNKFNSSFYTPLRIFFNNQFLKTFWVMFKNLYVRKQGIYSSNLFLTSIGLIFNKLSEGFMIKSVSSISNELVAIKPSTYYMRSVQLFTISIHKKVYSTFMWYIFNIIPTYYTPLTNTYNINYSFIFLKNHNNIYNFLNVFYLKLRNF